MSESFATYGEYLFSRHDLGEDEGALNLLHKKESYLREAPSEYVRPIVFRRWEHPAQNFDSHTHPKGAAVLRMLRWILGAEAFRRTVSRFLSEHAFQPVDTHDFQVAIKEATGQNLGWFVEQWAFKPAHPVFDVSYEWLGDRGILRLRVKQTQDTSRGAPVYRTPVVFRVHTARGRRSQRVWLERAEEVFELPCEDRPVMVRFDEGNYLLKEWTFLKDLAELAYKLRHDDVVGRIGAAGELGPFQADPEALAALRVAAVEDAFWAVREAATRTLGRSAGRDEREMLERLAATDASSKVRVAALEALGRNADSSLAGFFVERFEKDDSYLAQAEALRCLGRAGDVSHRRRFEAAAELRSPRDVLRSAAQDALAELAASEAEHPPIPAECVVPACPARSKAGENPGSSLLSRPATDPPGAAGSSSPPGPAADPGHKQVPGSFLERWRRRRGAVL